VREARGGAHVVEALTGRHAAITPRAEAGLIHGELRPGDFSRPAGMREIAAGNLKRVLADVSG
jgi:hypothetical protein